ncbi:hypothetical protein TNCV_60361 [Trichonephila clavipes]|nr:hypothetical protein TNCV_60361 [Trichonephila clavipes]
MECHSELVEVLGNRALPWHIVAPWAELWSEPDEIGNVIEEVADLARKINLEVHNNEVQELLDSHNQELTTDEHMEMHEQELKILKNLSF